ncbi:YegS/Rv2252/BmrU family lipid kinase [Ureibacillus xyleni]|uniref:YegS/Rv2252/BmrU family lipid kinase n=1 Tax=Ureibacillus xyleni TaxID=614648 RepID=A0A285S7E1_9BACL|nr:diacylglycerol kinase family protein [Ureibacillus xyleni]SOC03438.1 YegS/Rv2252/BmrU family lipid kinase [Ureibacillus xyleni]
MELHFIINEFAGNGKGKIVWQKLRKELKCTYSFHITKYNEHAKEIAQQLSEEASANGENILIIVVGGDGTIHGVLNGVMGFQDVFVGNVAAGSGNDFSRGYFSFQTAKQIEQFILQNDCTYKEMDSGVFKINTIQKCFINNAGIGFDAFVANLANQSKLKKGLNSVGLGKLSYVYFLLHGLFKFKLFDLTVCIEGVEKSYKNVWFVTICNQPYFGGGMKISPKSKPDDGLLEVILVHNLSRIKLLLLFVTVFFGAHTRLKAVVQTSAVNVKISVKEQILCHTDGEIIDTSTKNSLIEFEVQPKSWNLAKEK